MHVLLTYGDNFKKMKKTVPPCTDYNLHYVLDKCSDTIETSGRVFRNGVNEIMNIKNNIISYYNTLCDRNN
jgi:hypothetical protein